MTTPPRRQYNDTPVDSSDSIEPSDSSDHIERSIDPPRNFTITTEERVRAMAAGAPAYAVRKRRIEEAIDRYDRTLRDIAEASLLAGADDARISSKVRARAQRLDIAKTNKLIGAHNQYYPIEANLPMDLTTGRYLLMSDPWEPEPLLTVDGLVEGIMTSIRAKATTSDA
jgi:hypothetical protein